MRVPVLVKVAVFALVGGNVPPEQLVKAGEGIFKGKGTCEVCHRIGQKGTRAPDLAGIGAVAAKRKPGMTAKAYLIEALLGPGAPPGGAGAGGGGQAAEVKLPGDPKAGQAVFMGKGGCIACHKAGSIGASPVGPDLSQIAKIQTPEYIMAKILNPAGMGTGAGYPGGVMPATLGQTLTAKEYLDLVAFLLTLKGEGAAPAAKK